MVERKSRISPEQRTTSFFEQDVSTLGDRFVQDEGMIIALPNSNRKIRVREIEVFNKRNVGSRYQVMGDMEPGVLWNPPSRRIRQSLIVAQDKHRVGACLRLLRVNFYNPRTDSFVPTLKIGQKKFTQREGDLAEYLGLDKYDQSLLRFMDGSNTLYVIGKQQVESNATEKANRELEKLVR